MTTESPNCEVTKDGLAALLEEAERLRQENARLRTDIDRLLWWLEHSTEWPEGLSQIGPEEESDGELLPAGKWYFGNDVDENYFDSWRDAIDAVR